MVMPRPMTTPSSKAAAKAAKRAAAKAAAAERAAQKQAKRAVRRALRKAPTGPNPAAQPERDDRDDGDDSDDVDERDELDEVEDGEPGTDADAAGNDEATYTIDQLTAETGIPSRTIRFYQSSGVLPKPEKRGRIAYYGPHHVERLALIGQLQDRGLRMRAIKDLVEQIEGGDLVLNEWLGLEEQLQSAWVDDAPQILDRAGLEAMLGERRPGFVAELVRHGLVENRSDGTFLVTSPGLLRVSVRLDDGGVSLDVAAGAMTILQKHLARSASELAAHFAQHAGDGFGRGDSVQGITDAFRELRAISLESVRLIFAREMEQVLRRMVETGGATKLDKKRRKKR